MVDVEEAAVEVSLVLMNLWIHAYFYREDAIVVVKFFSDEAEVKDIVNGMAVKC